MASVIIDDETEYRILCPVCYTQFDTEQRKPKQLPCSHTVCINCLQEIIENGAILCPVCRSHHRCLHGVDQLNTNNDVLHIIKLNDQLRSQKYTALNERLQSETLVDELVKNYPPHHPNFFERLHRIMQFIAKDETRSLEFIWKIKDGWLDENLIEKLQNMVISFVSQLAPEQLDYLISDTNARWSSTIDIIAKRHLLDFMLKLAKETTHDSVIAEILDVMGSYIWCPDTPLELEDCCIDVFKKIHTNHWRNDFVTQWIFECIHRIQQRQSMVSAMKLLRHLCYMYAVRAAAHNDHHQEPSEFHQLIRLKYENIYTVLDQSWKLFGSVVEDLLLYMGSVRYIVQQNVEMGNRVHSHEIQIRERLAFLFAFIKYGRMKMDSTVAEEIWNCLVDRGVFETDWNTCFEWFAKIEMTPEVNRCIFYQHVLKLNPRQMTSVAMDCFEHLFRAVEYKEGDSVLEEIDLQPAIEFLWNVFQTAEDIAKQKAHKLLRETLEYLGPKLINPHMEIHCNEIGKYLDELVEKESKRRPTTPSRNSTMLFDHLAEMLEQDYQIQSQSPKSDQHGEDELMPQQFSQSAQLSRFNARTSIFILSVTKRGRLLGRIQIQPSPDFVNGKFMQELGEFCLSNNRKVGRRVTKACDTFVSVKMKNAMFQPLVPEMLNYRIWLDSQCLEKACQVGITAIENSRDNRVTGFQFVFLLRDTVGTTHQSKSKRVKPSLLFGDVVEGIDVVKLLSSRPQFCWNSEGLRFSLESV